MRYFYVFLPALTLTYLAEVTTPNLRGVLASTSSVSVISGVLIQFFLGTFLHWRSVALVSCVVPVLSWFLLFFVPESPYWLVSRKRLTEAQKSMAWLRGWLEVEDVEKEFKEFYEQLKKSSPADGHTLSQNNIPNSTSRIERIKKTVKLYGKKTFLWPFGIVSLAFGLGHFSGMTTLQTFAVNIFATLKAPIDKYYATIMLGIAELLGCTLSSILVHFVGKRRMNFCSLFGTGLCFFIVATYAYNIDVKYLQTSGLKITEEVHLDNQTWLPLTFLIGAAFCSHTGIRILPWMLIGEVYYSEIRASATGFSGAFSYVIAFISNKIFFSMISTLTISGTFWLYSCVCALGVILLYFWLPETEGKTLFQITEHFAGGEPLGNEVSNFIKLRKLKRNEEKANGTALGKVNVGFEEEDMTADGHIDIKL